MSTYREKIMSAETKLTPTLEDLLDFISKSKSLTVNYTEKGYKVYCYLSTDEKWNSPQCLIWITHCLLPEEKYQVKVEYRKEIIFSSDAKLDTDKVISQIHSTNKRINDDRLNKMSQEFLEQKDLNGS